MSNTHSLWPPPPHPPWKSAVQHHRCKKLPYPLPRIQSWQRFLLERLKVVRNLEQVVVVLYASCASRTKQISCGLLRIKVARNLEQFFWFFMFVCLVCFQASVTSSWLVPSTSFFSHTSSNIKWHVPLSVNWTFTFIILYNIHSWVGFKWQVTHFVDRSYVTSFL